MLRTAGWLALPGRALSAGFDGGISPPFSIRRRSATRRLGPYRDQTFTGKPNAASLDTHRRSALRQSLRRWYKEQDRQTSGRHFGKRREAAIAPILSLTSFG